MANQSGGETGVRGWHSSQGVKREELGVAQQSMGETGGVSEWDTGSQTFVMSLRVEREKQRFGRSQDMGHKESG